MQEMDTEAIRNQRRRRKRIGKMKTAIIGITAGWIILSMLLILFLLVKTISLEKKLDNLVLSRSGVRDAGEYLNGNQGAGERLGPGDGTEAEAGIGGTGAALISGMDDLANQAGAKDRHRVYLTFDDGPSERTAEILDILAEYDIKATFFVTGKEDEASRDLYKRIVDEGHTLGMHSYSNKYSEVYESREAFAEDYQKLRGYLKEVTGTDCRYYRFPGGSNNQISDVPMSSLISYLQEQGTVYFDWNITAGDAAASYTAEEIVANVSDAVVKYKTSVVLLHDSADKSETVEAVRPLIEALRGMGAEILPVDEDTSVIQYVKMAGTSSQK